MNFRINRGFLPQHEMSKNHSKIRYLEKSFKRPYVTIDAGFRSNLCLRADLFGSRDSRYDCFGKFDFSHIPRHHFDDKFFVMRHIMQFFDGIAHVNVDA